MDTPVAYLKELTESQFNRFRGVVYQESGIKLSESKRALMQARLMKRMRELRISGYEDYYNFLVDNYQEEVVNLINCITTNKTDYFREPKHFQFLTEVVLPEFDRMKKKDIRIWSAGCSTGEEPYSIAITLMEYFRGRAMPEVRILATDIDTQVLAKGSAGVYKAEILEAVDADLARKYFLRGRGEYEGSFMVKDSLKKLVYFRRLNLLNESYPMSRKFDVIFCRNVIIYFDRESQKRLFERFYRYLDGDGYLFVGHSETLTGVTDKFYFVKNTIYRKVIQE
jgi:chemotaxis protein methyltransferase CheR